MTGDGRGGSRTGPHTGPWIGHDDGLSERESQVLVLCAEGLSNREIADELYINVETVKSHLKHLYQRLGLRNRVEATAYVHRTAPDRMLQLAGRDDPSARTASRRDSSSAAAFDAAVIDEHALVERRRLMGLDEVARARLSVHAAAVERGAAPFVARQVARWTDQPATAVLVEDPAAQQRLVEHQRRYLVDLFAGGFGADHAQAMCMWVKPSELTILENGQAQSVASFGLVRYAKRAADRLQARWSAIHGKASPSSKLGFTNCSFLHHIHLCSIRKKIVTNSRSRPS